MILEFFYQNLERTASGGEYKMNDSRQIDRTMAEAHDRNGKLVISKSNGDPSSPPFENITTFKVSKIKDEEDLVNRLARGYGNGRYLILYTDESMDYMDVAMKIEIHELTEEGIKFLTKENCLRDVLIAHKPWEEEFKTASV